MKNHIEEMKKDICKHCVYSGTCVKELDHCATTIMEAEDLIEEGWRKNSLIAKDVFADIWKIVKVVQGENAPYYCINPIDFAKLKIKYTEEN